MWVHLRCNKFNLVDYKYLQGSADLWFCLSCCSTILPFGNLTEKDFPCSVLNKNYIEISNKNSSVLLKAPPNLAYLFNQFNNSSSEQQIDPENFVNSRYFDIDQIQSLNVPKKEKSLSFFHINACSLNKNFDDLAYLLQCTNNFDIIAVSETRISKKTSLTSNVKSNNYSFESTLTKSSAGGTMLYISNRLSYKP